MNTGLGNKAYPRSFVDNGGVSSYIIPTGGTGGLLCPLPLPESFVYFIKTPKHLVFNRKIIFQNNIIAPYTDLGPDVLCDHSVGVVQPWYIGFSVDGVLTNQQIIDQGMSFTVPPFTLEINSSKLPQPTDPLWDNKIYVHFYFGSGFVGYGILDQGLQIIKHDYDIKI